MYGRKKPNQSYSLKRFPQKHSLVHNQEHGHDPGCKCSTQSVPSVPKNVKGAEVKIFEVFRLRAHGKSLGPS
jgi:hypothetical protein